MPEVNERTHLLGHDAHQSNLPQPSITEEVIDLGKATIPISVSFAIQNIVQALSVVTSGSLSPDQLDIASYGFMFATCTG